MYRFIILFGLSIVFNSAAVRADFIVDFPGKCKEVMGMIAGIPGTVTSKFGKKKGMTPEDYAAMKASAQSKTQRASKTVKPVGNQRSEKEISAIGEAVQSLRGAIEGYRGLLGRKVIQDENGKTRMSYGDSFGTSASFLEISKLSAKELKARMNEDDALADNLHLLVTRIKSVLSSIHQLEARAPFSSQNDRSIFASINYYVLFNIEFLKSLQLVIDAGLIKIPVFGGPVSRLDDDLRSLARKLMPSLAGDFAATDLARMITASSGQMGAERLRREPTRLEYALKMWKAERQLISASEAIGSQQADGKLTAAEAEEALKKLRSSPEFMEVAGWRVFYRSMRTRASSLRSSSPTILDRSPDEMLAELNSDNNSPTPQSLSGFEAQPASESVIFPEDGVDDSGEGAFDPSKFDFGNDDSNLAIELGDGSEPGDSSKPKPQIVQSRRSIGESSVDKPEVEPTKAAKPEEPEDDYDGPGLVED